MASNEGTRRTVLAPTPFAVQLGAYLAYLVTSEGGDLSGRWLASRIDRSRSYCEKILRVQQAMTTNDIALIAGFFGVSPYQFVTNARGWKPGDESAPTTPPTTTPPSNVTDLKPRVGTPQQTESKRKAARPAEKESTDEQ